MTKNSVDWWSSSLDASLTLPHDQSCFICSGTPISNHLLNLSSLHPLRMVTKTPTSSRLLDLPRELRDKVLADLISIPDQPPKDWSPSLHRRPLIDIEYKSWFYYGRHNKYLYNNHPNFIPTLLVNRQLRAETQAAIKIHPLRTSYMIDVMLVNEKELWPT